VEKKSTLPFIILMTIGFVGLVVVQSLFFKPQIPDSTVDNSSGQKVAGELAEGTEDDPSSGTESQEDEPESGDPEPERPQLPREFLTLGAFDAEGLPLVLTLDSRGATVRRIELNTRRGNGALKYTDVDYRAAYIGHLELTADQDGPVVNVVTAGSPADLAGLQVNDTIRSIDGEPVTSPEDFALMLAEIKPGMDVQLAVQRGGSQNLSLTATTTKMPMQIIRPTDPELLTEQELKRRAFQFTLKEQKPGDWPDIDEAMRTANWEGQVVERDGKQVAEFVFDLPASKAGEKLQVLKRYALSDDPERSFHVDLSFELRNLGEQPTVVNYELTGPTGLPREGWWYQMKIHGGTWAIGKMAGARDITMSTDKQPFKFLSGPQIVTDKTQDPPALTSIVDRGADDLERSLRYVGVDTLYFNVALIPKQEDYKVYSAYALTAAQLDEVKARRKKLTDVSFVLYSDPIELAPYDEANPATAHTESFEIFAGPKDPDVLAKYGGLSDTRTFGWFAMFSKPLIWLLHKLYALTFSWSYGLAIILLTVIVRLCMVPISRKAALNAQMMQYLAPQMKELQDKHKEDPKKFFQARSELCARHNYKPLGGCLLMFVQLPIFLGLYRGLSVDVELRNAPLIPGLEWCTNLGGPDKLFEWSSWMPSFLGGETGFLGPYFNLLPILAIVLMFLQQKLFMPPATDDQSAMAQKMMKFMMIFMGFIFFKVAAGLCIYFVTSSIWGIVERKMLPKPELDTSRFDASADGSVAVKKPQESMPLRNDKELEERNVEIANAKRNSVSVSNVHVQRSGFDRRDCQPSRTGHSRRDSPERTLH